ncbi:MAG: NUDIX hydrolase [Planctomycetota bacterium]|jgi:8-oxo-dGTP pyrophosphatase MutT (NUDIX family)|nr:NUDIX hydrolase [Planctomycetota bacterium]
MSGNHGWRRLGARTLIDDRWLKVDALRLATPTGTILDPYYLLTENAWACVVPVTSEGKLVVVEQYRPGADALTLEFPAGDIDPGEDPATSAARELSEETGYRPIGPLHPLGSLMPEPSRNTGRGTAFVVLVAPAGPAHADPAEAIRVCERNSEQIEAAIDTGLFCHAAHVAFYYQALTRNLLCPEQLSDASDAGKTQT